MCALSNQEQSLTCGKVPDGGGFRMVPWAELSIFHCDKFLQRHYDRYRDQNLIEIEIGMLAEYLVNGGCKFNWYCVPATETA